MYPTSLSSLNFLVFACKTHTHTHTHLSNTYVCYTYDHVCCMHLLCLVVQSCPTLYDHTYFSPPGFSVHGDSPGKNTGEGSLSLLHGIFPTQGSNPGLPHCRQILNHLSHQTSPCMCYIYIYIYIYIYVFLHLDEMALSFFQASLWLRW